MTHDPSRADPLVFWRNLAANGVLQCPACNGALRVTDEAFACVACMAAYPVESGVPLLMRPQDVVSIPGRVMEAFHIGEPHRKQVEAALASLVKYRTPSQPEFSNFFARFEPPAAPAQSLVLSAEQLEDALKHVECVTPHQPATLSSDEVEFRSIRLLNNSDRVLFTSESTPLFLSYRLFTTAGDLIEFDASRSPLPCPLRPGAELTIPAMVQLPPGANGEYLVRFYFMLATTRLAEQPDRGSWRLRWKKRPAPALVEAAQWFETAPVLEMRVTAVSKRPAFPAVRRGNPQEFDVQDDVGRADEFLRQVIGELRAAGVDGPRILEIGAGIHPMAMRVADGQAEVVVSDISLVMQTIALVMHSNFPAMTEGRAGFTSFDMMHPPFANGTFDIICICAALHHVARPAEFLERVASMLSPHGRFVAVREPCVVSPSEPTYLLELSNGFNEQMFELSEWTHFLDVGGLTIDRAFIDFGCSLKFSARPATALEACSAAPVGGALPVRENVDDAH